MGQRPQPLTPPSDPPRERPFSAILRENSANQNQVTRIRSKVSGHTVSVIWTMSPGSAVTWVRNVQLSELGGTPHLLPLRTHSLGMARLSTKEVGAPREPWWTQLHCPGRLGLVTTAQGEEALQGGGQTSRQHLDQRGAPREPEAPTDILRPPRDSDPQRDTSHPHRAGECGRT